MPVQPDPPITLDPSQDTGHQLAFINQNFQSIANVLATNSFKIAKTGTTIIPTSATANSSVTVPHGLNHIPAILAYVQLSQYVPFPAFSIATDLTIATWWYNGVDSTNAYFYVSVKSGNTVTFTTNVKYYLLEETAN